MTGLRLAGEKKSVLHFSETEVLGSCSVWRGGTHKGENNGREKGERQRGKVGRQGVGDCWREGKEGFAVFRDGSPGIVLTELAAELWEAHGRESQNAIAFHGIVPAVAPFMHHILYHVPFIYHT